MKFGRIEDPNGDLNKEEAQGGLLSWLFRIKEGMFPWAEVRDLLRKGVFCGSLRDI